MLQLKEHKFILLARLLLGTTPECLLVYWILYLGAHLHPYAYT